MMVKQRASSKEQKAEPKKLMIALLMIDGCVVIGKLCVGKGRSWKGAVCWTEDGLRTRDLGRETETRRVEGLSANNSTGS